MRRLIAVVSGFVLLAGSVAGAASASTAAQPAAAAKVDPWIARSTKVQFQRHTVVDAPAQIELPKKDWLILPASGALLFVATSKKGDAVVLVERSTLRQPLEPADITDLFAQIETDAIKERQAKATDFQSRVLDAGEHRMVAVQYARPGVLGSERVRQYSLPIGRQLYRVTFISSAAQFPAYDPVFSHIAASFTATE